MYSILRDAVMLTALEHACAFYCQEIVYWLVYFNSIHTPSVHHLLDHVSCLHSCGHPVETENRIQTSVFVSIQIFMQATYLTSILFICFFLNSVQMGDMPCIYAMGDMLCIWKASSFPFGNYRWELLKSTFMTSARVLIHG